MTRKNWIDPKHVTIAIIGWLCASSLALSAFNASSFEFVKSLSIEPVTDVRICTLSLDEEIFAASNDNLADIRLIDDREIEIPFIIRRDRGEEVVVTELTLDSERISGSVEPGEWIEVIEKITDESTSLPNAVMIQTSLRDFEKLVDIEGSPDGIQWESLASGAAIYDYSRFIDLRRVQIEFAPTPHRFFKIRIGSISELKESPLMQISRDIGSDTETVDSIQKTLLREDFRVESVRFISRRFETRQTEDLQRTFRFTQIEVTHDPQTKRSMFETSAGRLPAMAIDIVTTDENFSRHVQIEGQTTGGKWISITRGVMSSIRIGDTRREALRVDFPGEFRLERTRLTFDNRDNQPLTIQGVDVIYNARQLVFLISPERSYRLFYGSDIASVPQYDLNEVLVQPASGSIIQANPDSGKPNPNFAGSRKNGLMLFQGSWLIWISGVIAVGILGWLIFVAVKKTESVN